MDWLQIALLLGLVPVVLAQILHRLFGTVLGLAWCLTAMAWGGWSFAHGRHVELMGIPAPPWAFLVFMGLLAAYHLFVAARLVRARTAGTGRRPASP